MYTDDVAFRYPQEDIPWREKEKIRHEINNVYSKYKGLPIITHRSIGFDNRYYIYYVENRGFDDYNIFSRVEDREDDDDE